MFYKMVGNFVRRDELLVRANAGNSNLEHESNVFWLRDIQDIPYVREYVLENCSWRKSKLKY